MKEMIYYFKNNIPFVSSFLTINWQVDAENVAQNEKMCYICNRNLKTT